MYRLELIDITKRYPSITANDGVSLAVRPGEIHAVFGENGAGKSTLMKVIYRKLQPDAGELRWNGERLEAHGPGAASARGIAMVFQHFSLFDSLTVAQNVWIGRGSGVSRPSACSSCTCKARASTSRRSCSPCCLTSPRCWCW
jgi:ABC-type uncharacterized transport system ATPase subunit